jgi:hypothetical protein
LSVTARSLTNSPGERTWSYLDLVDFLLIGEAALGVDAADLARVTQLNLAASALDAPAAEFGGVEFYPEFRMTPPTYTQVKQAPTPPFSRPEEAPLRYDLKVAGS